MPDPGLLPLIATRMAAEVPAQADGATLRAALQRRPRPETPPSDAEPLTRQPVPSQPS